MNHQYTVQRYFKQEIKDSQYKGSVQERTFWQHRLHQLSRDILPWYLFYGSYYTELIRNNTQTAVTNMTKNRMLENKII